MIKRRPIEQKTGHERWLVSYADFITLLFAFFVVMYSVSHVSEEKYRALSETLNAAFSESNIATGQVLDADSNIGNAESLVELAILAETMQERLGAFSVAGTMSMSANENWIELTLSSEVLFGSGSAIPKPEAQSVFTEISDLLAAYDNEIQIVGHTDSVPINTLQHPNNWALSSARAVSIVNYMSFQGIEPQRMSAIAYGEHRPIADNLNEDGRRQNRRVVIRVASHGVRREQNVFSVPLQDGATETTVAEGDELELAPENTVVSAPVSTNLDENHIQPVRLKGGDLLFTTDPDLPRLRELEED